MKTERNILVAFILNFAFAIFEFFGGIFSGSVAIMSDAVHDAGDSLSIGLSFVFEKISKKEADKKYTFGYSRYSVLSSIITTLVLILGSAVVIYNAVCRIIDPVVINYNSMIIFAIIGVCVNFCAAVFTHGGGSLNQKAVNLHMLEDVMSWIVVLMSAIVMKFTDFALLDPVMSILVALFIVLNAIKNLKKSLDVFLMKAPSGVDIDELAEHILEVDGVLDVHHFHLWSMDGYNSCAMMHIVADGDVKKVKEEVKEELKEHGIAHITIEFESEDEHCHDKKCRFEYVKKAGCSHSH